MKDRLIDIGPRTYKYKKAARLFKGQAALEYIILFIAVTAGIALGSRAFFTFDGQGTGEARNIAEELFEDAAEDILGYSL